MKPENLETIIYTASNFADAYNAMQTSIDNLNRLIYIDNHFISEDFKVQISSFRYKLQALRDFASQKSAMKYIQDNLSLD